MGWMTLCLRGKGVEGKGRGPAHPWLRPSVPPSCSCLLGKPGWELFQSGLNPNCYLSSETLGSVLISLGLSFHQL